MAAWGFALGNPFFFERKCFPDRLGLGLVLPLYLDNDSFGVGMHAVSYYLTGYWMAAGKVHLLLVSDVDLIFQDFRLFVGVARQDVQPWSGWYLAPPKQPVCGQPWSGRYASPPKRPFCG